MLKGIAQSAVIPVVMISPSERTRLTFGLGIILVLTVVMLIQSLDLMALLKRALDSGERSTRSDYKFLLFLHKEGILPGKHAEELAAKRAEALRGKTQGASH